MMDNKPNQRYSEPLAAPMRSSYMPSTLSLQFTLALVSGG
jgi:hypothetical protein